MPARKSTTKPRVARHAVTKRKTKRKVKRKTAPPGETAKQRGARLIAEREGKAQKLRDEWWRKLKAAMKKVEQYDATLAGYARRRAAKEAADIFGD